MAKHSEVIGKVSEIIRRVIEGTDLELVEVKYLRERGKWVLQIYIDKPTGVTVEDCRWVNDEVGRELDQLDFLPYAYMLEVSSPGVERLLSRKEDFERFTGKKVEIRTQTLYRGKKKFTGILRGMEEDQVLLEEESGEIFSFPVKEISFARLKFEWRGKP